MKKNIFRIFKLLLIIFCIYSVLFSLVLAQNEYHLESCHKAKCGYCIIIQNAILIINITILFFVIKKFKYLLFYCLSIFYNRISICFKNTLVIQNVQLNE